MRPRRPLLPASVLVLLAVVVGVAGCAAFRPYAATVNGERISQGSLTRELEAILGNEKYLEQQDASFANQFGEPARGAGKDTFNSVFVAAVLERRIAFTLIHQEVERRRLTVSAAQRQEIRDNLVRSYTKAVFNDFPAGYRDDLVRIFAEAATLEKALGDPVGDADVKKFYDEHPEAFRQTCVRHILVATREQAAAVKARIDGGEDFAAIAKAESTDNQGAGASAEKGGDLGCVPAGSFVPEFEKAMDALQPGQVSEPVETQFGFHIIQVSERKTQTLEEAEPQIRSTLERDRADVVQAFVSKALVKAKIKVNPRYGEFVKTGRNIGVRAPKQLETPSSTEAPPLPQPSR